MIRECVICGAEFKVYGSSKTCSKECSKIRKKEYNNRYRKENPEKIKFSDANYRKENREKDRNRLTEWRKENPEKTKAFDAKYRKENRERVNARATIYRKENRERVRASNIKYKKENVEKVRASYRKTYHKYKDISSRKINRSMSSSVYKSLKGGKNGAHWEDIAGYTLEELKVHLELLFEDWMTWDNYGNPKDGEMTWHIDHIIPKSLFIFESYEDQAFKDCWALSNLRPLERIKNIKKGNRLIA